MNYKGEYTESRDKRLQKITKVYKGVRLFTKVIEVCLKVFHMNNKIVLDFLYPFGYNKDV